MRMKRAHLYLCDNGDILGRYLDFTYHFKGDKQDTLLLKGDVVSNHPVFKGKQKEEAIKRAIHTFNLAKTLVPHVHDEDYGYTEEDEHEWDDFCKMLYGTNLKE